MKDLIIPIGSFYYIYMTDLYEIVQEGILDAEEMMDKADKSAEFISILNAFNDAERNGCDCLGNELSPGDLVLYIPGKGSSSGKLSLQLGMVKNLTPKGVTAIVAPYKSNRWGMHFTPDTKIKNQYGATIDRDVRNTVNFPFRACIKISKEKIV